MRKYEVYKSSGGYRVAAELVHGSPVITDSKWYETRRGAVCAANNMRRSNLQARREPSRPVERTVEQ